MRKRNLLKLPEIRLSQPFYLTTPMTHEHISRKPELIRAESVIIRANPELRKRISESRTPFRALNWQISPHKRCS
jgi:hypothetical protein